LAVVTTLAAVVVATPSIASGTPTRSVVSDASDHFSFALPSQWLQVPLTGKELQYFIDQAAKNDPALKGFLSGQASQIVKSKVKIFAVGPYTKGFFPNVNVIVASSSGTTTRNAFFQAADAQLAVTLTAAGFQHLHVTNLNLALGGAVRVTYELQLKGHAQVLQGQQLYVLHSTKVVIITSTSLSQGMDKSILGSIVKSWRWS
jgi:hypothetical protein